MNKSVKKVLIWVGVGAALAAYVAGTGNDENYVGEFLFYAIPLFLTWLIVRAMLRGLAEKRAYREFAEKRARQVHRFWAQFDDDGDGGGASGSKPPPPPPPPGGSRAVPASWRADPSQRHELRYWDGSSWTDHVSDAGVTGTDPFAATPIVDR